MEKFVIHRDDFYIQIGIIVENTEWRTENNILQNDWKQTKNTLSSFCDELKHCRDRHTNGSSAAHNWLFNLCMINEKSSSVLLHNTVNKRSTYIPSYDALDRIWSRTTEDIKSRLKWPSLLEWAAYHLAYRDRRRFVWWCYSFFL